MVPTPVSAPYVGRVIWLNSPPWGRWLTAGLIALAALWMELRPPDDVDHPFAVADLAPGTMVDESNTEMRPVPEGLLAPVDLGGAVRVPIRAGDPVLASSLDDAAAELPTGWWRVELPVPAGAEIGDRARVVVVDTGTVAEGVVVDPGVDDPLSAQTGAIAVEPKYAAEVAAAAVEGRVAVMIATP